MNPEYPFQPQQQPGATPPAGYPPQQPGYGYQPQPGQMPPAPQPVRGATLSPSKKWVIVSVVFIVMTLALAGLSVWALMNYFDQKNNVDSKVANAVAIAVKEEKENSEQAIIKAAKEPNLQFAGPEDYGRLAFKYPKNWSAYEAKDASSGGTYEVYFSPGVIPPAARDQRYALRVTIEDQDYDKVVSTYEKLVKSGELKSSAITINDQTGTRLDGAFTKDIKGAAVIIKIRDKTATLRTDADVFMEDFNALIKTIEFNK